MKRLSRLIILLLLLMVVLLAWLTTTQSGLRWGYEQASRYLPGELNIAEVHGRLIGPITLRGFEFEHEGTRVKADKILLDWQPMALLTTQINISRVHIQSLDIVLPEPTETTKPEPTLPGIQLPEIHLPWGMALQEAQIDDFSFSRGEQNLKLNQIKLSANTQISTIKIKTFSVSADNFNLNIKGKLKPVRNYRHDLAINWQLKLPSGEQVDGSGRLKGDVQSTRLSQQLRGPLQLSLNAELNDLLDQLNWQTEIKVSAFDLSRISTDLPALNGALQLQSKGDLNTATLSATMNGHYPDVGAFESSLRVQRLSGNTLQLDQLQLRTPDGNTLIDSQGTWTPGDDGGEFKLTLDWQNLRWPLQAETPAVFNSANGSGSVEGTMQNYRISLKSDSPWPELLPSSWTAQAEGNLDGLTLQSLRVTALEGEAVATGQLNWSAALNWQLEVNAEGINPAGMLPQWPGQLNAKLNSSGRIDQGELSAEAEINQLSGTLRGYPVSLQSQLKWRDNGLDLNQFEARSGEAQISAQGRLAETLKLDWSIAADNLAELYPQAQGQLHATGRVTGPPATPTIQTTFKGQALALADYRIDALDGDLSVDLFQWQQLEINLSAQALELNGYILQSLDVTSAEQRIELEAIADELTAHFKLYSRTDAQGWHGRLEQADIRSQDFDHWQLRAPASLEVSETAIQAEPICLQSSEGEVCLTLHHQDDLWQAKLNAEQIPLQLLGPWLPVDLILDGKFNASTELNLQAPDQLLGEGKIELLPGTVSYPLLEGERERWEYNTATLSFFMQESGITASAEISTSKGDQMHFKAELPQAQLLTLDPAQQPLSAEVRLAVQDLKFIEALLLDVQDLEGKVNVNLSAAGTLARPRLSGEVRLLNASLRLPRLGLNITEVSLNGESETFNKFGFSLDARSGSGRLAITGQTLLDSTAGWPTEINIKGDEFEVSRIPEARILATPDLQVNIKNRSIKVRGGIHIPYARLQPKDITTATRVSEDAVIVGREQIKEEIWLIDTRVRLTLGERVHFYGYGFEGRLGGSLLLEDQPGQLTKATGEITVEEGRYRAYGQRLEIEHGRLVFTGGSLTNPGLDMRAVRKVDAVTAGIRVRGSLRQPQLELFSTPAMGQTDILSYLMLGGPIDSASGEQGAMMAQAALALSLSGGDQLARTLGDRFGLDEMRVESSATGDQASLVVGRYLSPRLYISYGVGLIESFNTLMLRYRISSKWHIKVESGEYHGADIIYTIER
ncbi:MAG: translocation/assembly module TamB domain-containing protein [Gammaproteobacteria bacterium]|jgi:translocation and assembly module TamB|nr:translocation/assembly module TamB domain-containing protein [Gammaproteobacteria bacterium]